MAVNKPEAAVATFSPVDAAGAPLVSAAPTIRFYYPDGSLLVTRQGADVTEDPAGTYSAWASTDRAGIHQAELSAVDSEGKWVYSFVDFVVTDREQDHIIAGY